jgi:CP family cyanate transporter-like MFS transporter
VLLFVVALNLRPALTTVGPLLPQIGATEGISESTQGLLGALPLIAFGVASLLVPRLSARFGPERAVLAALLVLGTGVLVRSFGGPSGLWVGTVVLGAAIAVGNVIVPALIKRDDPGNMVRSTGVYSACLALSAGIGAAIAVPIAQATDWRISLAVWAVPAFAAAALWWPRARSAQRGTKDTATTATDARAPAVPNPAAPTASVWRQPTAWFLTAFMGLQSTAFYVLITWLPTIDVSYGVSEAQAGLHILGFQAIGVVAGLAIPRLMRGPDSQVAAALFPSCAVIVGVSGLIVAPSVSLLWILIAGLGTGSSLVVALSLISMRGRTHDEVTRLSGMAQSVGYLLAAGGPVAAGALAERTGSWDSTLVMLAILSVVQLGIGIVAGKDRRRPTAALT